MEIDTTNTCSLLNLKLNCRREHSDACLTCLTHGVPYIRASRHLATVLSVCMSVWPKCSASIYRMFTKASTIQWWCATDTALNWMKKKRMTRLPAHQCCMRSGCEQHSKKRLQVERKRSSPVSYRMLRQRYGEIHSQRFVRVGCFNSKFIWEDANVLSHALWTHLTPQERKPTQA